MEDNLKAQYLIANVDTKAKIRYEKFEDVKHLVVPVIAAQQGVMNNLFYPAEEFRDWIETWNGVPVPISHPMVNGIAVSAKTPRIQELTSVGWFFNVEFTKDNKLKGEIWINTDKIAKLNAKYIIDKFENGDIMEVSTGLYSNVEMISGEYNGKSYDAIVRHIRPDHLALLPNEIGACSIEDGCGAMRNNNCACQHVKLTQDICACKKDESKITDNENEIKEDVTLEVDQKNQNEIEVIGNEQNGGGKMESIKSLVQNVIANIGDKFTPEETEKLESLGEEMLTKMTNNEETQQAEESTEEAVTEQKSEEQQEEQLDEKQEEQESKEDVVESEEKQTTEQKANSLIEKIEDVELKDFLSNAMQQFETKKITLINTIVESTKLTQEEVKAMPINQIEKLADSFKKATFNGRGTTLKEEEEMYEYKPKTLQEIFAKKESK